MSKEEVMRLVKEQMAIPNVKSPNPTPRGIGKEEVNKAVQEALAATQEENVERNAQVSDCYYIYCIDSFHHHILPQPGSISDNGGAEHHRADEGGGHPMQRIDRQG